MEKLLNPNQEVMDFRKFNLLFMILLSFITLGAYIGVWFLQHKQRFEEFSQKTKLYFGWWKFFTIFSFVFLFIKLFGSMVLSEYGIVNIQSYETIFNFFFIGLLYYSIFRLKDCLEEEYDLYLNKYLLFFFHIFYIQFKLNQVHSTSER
ncbi:hypothetical protein [Ureibacillus aquaedulcis]|uniref:DUF4234 domain-containing protein n=1 Tax=Ureibacillus aquaedulcis TaxID=3058421 RepID=A0ABT8GLF0_9BACL|nr:hypothetical protein [Ureibacillus sp. BA0131]MDN4492242.1 hypothetical protein [Ureibacillus sp. BA0131]